MAPLVDVVKMLWRSYNEVVEPENDEIIKKAVGFAKKLIIEYHNKMGERRTKEIRDIIDKKNTQMTDELNDVFIFYNDKGNIGGIQINDFKFIDDRILSAVKVYGVFLRKESSTLILEGLKEEIRIVDKLLEKHSRENGNYDLYTELYRELDSGLKAIV